MAPGGHRITHWHDQAGNIVQVSVACIDALAELVCEVTEAVGPFDDLEERLEHATAVAHSLGGWRAHQAALPI